MITVTVTSDSSVPELRVAERTLADLIKLAIGKDMELDSLKENLNNARTELKQAISTAADTILPTLNATELAEAEQLGKPACSTVDGIKWDKRIHSSSKELNKDGTWRKRRGVADELVRSVEAEFRGGYSPIPSVVVSVDAPAPPVNPVPLVVDATGKLVPEMTFTELLDGVTKAMVAGTLSQATIAAALDSVGLTALPHLLGNTALIPAFREALGGVV